MTERLLLSLSTQPVNPSQNPSPPIHVLASNDVSHAHEQAEEEPYTIKCICGFSDDDGNTIFCEACETWQHTECYYPDRMVEALEEDFDHSCQDCKTRFLDRNRALERQRNRHSTAPSTGSNDRKPKRPPSKSHKKKSKPNGVHTNGHSDHDSPQLHTHPAKKLKTGHKSSHSISHRRSPGRPSNNGHPPSPATTPPDFPQELHSYSQSFRSLYDETDSQTVGTNSFASLTITNILSSWQHDKQQLRRDTGHEYQDVFQALPPHLGSSRPSLHVQEAQRSWSNDSIKWKFLTTREPITKDVPLLEMNGQIGFQKDYCAIPEHRWEELTTPLPFVFFHPMLPLSIDTRHEGSEARYVRRSCKPNSQLDTYISDGAEYHFWLVSDRAIAAGEQITLPWDFRFPTKNKARTLRLLGLSDEEQQVVHEEGDIDEDEYAQLALFIHTILSEYGGCACDLAEHCAFVQFHQNYLLKLEARIPKKKTRKPKTHALSPTSTGRSREASETHMDDYDHSERSKASSREITPARQGSFDAIGVLTEETSRDKRKLQMAEDTFRKMEQQTQPVRKKKRVSDSTTGGPNKKRSATSHTIDQVNGTSERNGYVDAATWNSASGSPSSARSPSVSMTLKAPFTPSRQPSAGPTRSSYADAGTQTEPETGAWYCSLGQSETPKPRRRVVSLSRRLLNNRHLSRMDSEEGLRRSVTPRESVDPDTPVSTARRSIAGMDLSPTSVSDAVMVDAPAAAAADVTPVNGAGHKNALDLKVQLPPVPAFHSSTSSTSNVNTPMLTNGSLLPSPFSLSGGLTSPFVPTAVNGLAPMPSPSPVKKKISWSDYRSKKSKPSTIDNKAIVGTDEAAKSNIKTEEVVSPAVDKMMVDVPIISSAVTESKSADQNQPDGVL